MKCKKCGEELPDRAQFCFVCGTPIEDVPEPRKLEEPLDPLAAGAVPLVPIAPPPRAYKFEPKAMRSASARGERRVITVSPEVAERAERAERGFVLPFVDRAEKSARAAASVSKDEKVEDEETPETEAPKAEAVTEHEPVTEPEAPEEQAEAAAEKGETAAAPKEDAEEPGAPEDHGSDETAPACDDGEETSAAPEAPAAPEPADDASKEDGAAEEKTDLEPAEPVEEPDVPAAPKTGEAEAEAMDDTAAKADAAPMPPAPLSGLSDDVDDASADSLNVAEDFKDIATAPLATYEEMDEPPLPERDDSFVREPKHQASPAHRGALGRFKGPELILAGVMLVAAVIVVVLLAGLATSWIGPFSPAPEEAPKVQPPSNGDIEPIVDEDPEEDGLPEDAPEPRATVADYSWQELSQISAIIADAATDEDALEIAGEYHLCATDGTLDGSQTKDLTLSDGTVVTVAVAGFRQDTRADGSGMAGISFIAREPITNRAVDPSGETPAWGETSLFSWLNEDLLDELPDELAEVIVPVTKTTNTLGGPQEETTETLWLPSFSELAGEPVSGSALSGAYTTEGDQYKLFADQGVNSSGHDFLVLSDGQYWWTRSVDVTGLDGYASVSPDGNPYWTRNTAQPLAVLPGFCL